jgi:hypothetical protein
MIRTRITIIILLFFISRIQAQTPNWAETIAPIFYKNCTSCHHPDGIAPTSYLDYNDVIKQAYTIRYQVVSKLMPPWPADPTYRHYADERVLKQNEIDAIKTWVDNGMLSGDLNKAPAKPFYSKDSKIGAYDLKVKIPKYTSSAKTADVYRCFSIPTNLPSNKFISAVEVVPGNPKIVHHVLVFQDTTSTTDNLDNADPLPGYTNFGGTGSQTSILIAPYVPGAEPITFPSGTGVKLYKNARIILQIHYPQGTENELDSTYVVLRYSTQPSVREVFIAPILNQGNITNGPFYIEKDVVKTFYQEQTIPLDATILSVMPHMHLIGKSTKVFSIPPVGDTIPLVRINDWEFHWQGEYKFQYLQKISKGSKLKSIVTYDNTVNNHHQPSNPPKPVTLGESTTNEMILTYFYYMAYQSGDEKILQDSNLLLTGISRNYAQKLNIYPNPAKNLIYFNLPVSGSMVQYKITDQVGRTLQTGKSSDVAYPLDDFNNRKKIDLIPLKAGVYYLELESGSTKYLNRFIVE